MWNKFENGKTIASSGSESGIIINDEEHESGARITLEKNTTVAPFSITCGIYGSFFHTLFLSTEDKAKVKYSEMKTDIASALERELSDEEYYEWIDNFVEKY